jgi:hypothetical protein
MVYNPFHLYCDDCGSRAHPTIVRGKTGFSSLTGKPKIETQRRMACSNQACPRYASDRAWKIFDPGD